MSTCQTTERKGKTIFIPLARFEARTAQIGHFDVITKYSERQFIERYLKWAKKKEYHQSEAKAVQVYKLAKDGIPTISSNTPSTKMLLLEAIKAFREVNSALFAI